MTGLLKRKFDQLEEDGSSSSSSVSGRLSLSSFPISSASPAGNSDEEGPGGQAPQPHQDSCGLQSFTREYLILGAPCPPPSSFPKTEVGLFGLCSPFRVPPSVKSCDCSTLQRHLDFLLTVGVVLLESETSSLEWLWLWGL